MACSRRDFMGAALLGSLSLGVNGVTSGQKSQGAAAGPKVAKKPVLISAANGFNYLDAGYELLRKGSDTLDAALRVVRGPEDDPNDDSVGLGGLPNEEGVVELDSCCMHGPTRRAGAVGGVHEIKNVSLLAKAVMEHTGHVMLVGDNASKFGFEMGFARENLLTERSRKVWLLWKEFNSDRDWWGPGLADPRWRAPGAKPTAERWRAKSERLQQRAAELGIEEDFRPEAIRRVLLPPTGTIHCSALNEKGEMSGTTTTSGLAWKVPGRVGDSPIVGAGCYTDQDVGSAGATGSGEENIKVCGAHTIVENMRRGMAPEEAGMDALRRIARNYNNDMTRLKYVDMTYYILRKDGAYAGVSLWTGYEPSKPHKIAVHDGNKRLEPCAFLFQGASQEWPPMPNIPAELRQGSAW